MEEAALGESPPTQKSDMMAELPSSVHLLLPFLSAALGDAVLEDSSPEGRHSAWAPGSERTQLHKATSTLQVGRQAPRV